MNKLFLPALLALILSACSSTGDTPATVEDRTGSMTSSGQAAGDGKPAGGTETTGLGDAGVKGSALDGSGSYAGDPRKDPASPLSKRSIYFDFDSFVVKDEFRPALEAHAAYLLSKRDAKVVLQGNTDERGSREYNLALGGKRSEAVKKALLLLGAREDQVESVSLGEEKPACTEQTEDCWAKNRRGDMLYSGEF